MCTKLQADLAELMAIIHRGDRKEVAEKLAELQRDYFKYSKMARQMIDIWTDTACKLLGKV